MKGPQKKAEARELEGAREAAEPINESQGRQHKQDAQYAQAANGAQEIKGPRAFAFLAAWLSALAFLALACGCSHIPKVIIIDDPLSKDEHYALGLTYENSGEMELAEREYRLALPQPLARLALGNLSWQVRGDAKEAMGYYRQALAADKIPGAANNLAWLLLLEGGSLTEARDLAAMAVEEAISRGEPEKDLESYRGTLAQIEAAIKAGKSDPPKLNAAP